MLLGQLQLRFQTPNYRSSGRAVNKLPGLSRSYARAMTRRRAAQLWR